MDKQLCPHCGVKWIPESMEKFIKHVQSCNKPEKPSKYKNKRTEYNGMMFDSKLEAEYCKLLDSLVEREDSDLWYYQRQVPFHLPGKIIYRVDFMEVWERKYDGTEIRYVDTKGFETETFKIKKKLVESLYPVEIVIVKKGDF